MKVLVTLSGVAFMLVHLSAQYSAEQRIAHYNVEENNLAIEGHDPVAYFTMAEAIQGKEDISHTHRGITYHFMSINNRDLFKVNPEKYEPQYGGWCGYSTATEGKKQKVDPGSFIISDGNLYLFYNSLFKNHLKRWLKNEEEMKTKAEANWTGIMQE